MARNIEESPYIDTLQDIVASIMRAQAEVALSLASGVTFSQIDHQTINRHFTWLTQAYPVGINRHLFEAPDSASLRARGSRAVRQLPPRYREMMEQRLPLPLNEELELYADEQGYALTTALVQTESTRISRLVLASLLPREDASVAERGIRRGKSFILRSPLAVAYEYLSVPASNGTQAYALLAIRSFLFETYQTFPDGVPGFKGRTFSVRSVQQAMSHIWTFIRPRFNSKGLDPVPAEGRGKEGGILRHFLASKGMLWLRFEDILSCIKYLQSLEFRSKDAGFEFVRSSNLDRLPDVSEITNELWGVPIPIRGADTVFRGGLKFSSRGGLLLGVHGGPGTGKTSLALALGCYLAPFGIETLFLTAEEHERDLHVKVETLIPDDLRRLSFFPADVDSWLTIQTLDYRETKGSEFRNLFEERLASLSLHLKERSSEEPEEDGAPKVCRFVVVLDGVHDLLDALDEENLSASPLATGLRDFVLRCKDLNALVILTAYEDWSGRSAFEYLVDVAVGLTNDASDDYVRKPDRRITVTKARHQLCAIGTHGLQLAGSKGVRLSPQINYQLERKSIWRTRLPNMNSRKKVLSHGWTKNDFSNLRLSDATGRNPSAVHLVETGAGVYLFPGSNIFLNGKGSGAKAALALKIAISPTFDDSDEAIKIRERVLVVSFLYPDDYYELLLDKLAGLRNVEYPKLQEMYDPIMNVIHLYPGNYRADQLFNRVQWELDSAELSGDPYTCVIIDGLHNVFLQFPEIESYKLFWPQLYAALRTRPLTIISTHTTFVMEDSPGRGELRLDDQRSDPLRHALVQKTDFRFDIDPETKRSTRGGMIVESNNFMALRTISAINQPLPMNGHLLWSREHLVLVEAAQGTLGL